MATRSKITKYFPWMVSFCSLVWLAFTLPPRARAVALPYAPAPVDNPLKGFLPYAGPYANFPHSMEWFYIPLKDIQTDYDRFHWDMLEDRLQAIAGRGHQAVFRVYLDYPDSAYGVPDFLAHVPKHAYTDGGNGAHHASYSPDYENADLRRALTHFIHAFGKRYDGDPRIGFITLGLLGFWGEWHTYPHDWNASTVVQNEVLTAYETAFHHTKLLMREPKPGTHAADRNIGYHDDSFAFQTLPPPDWHFWGKVIEQGAGDKWKTQAIGGELRPEVQGCLWDDNPCTPIGQEFDRCVTETHASRLLNKGAFSGLAEGRYARAVAAARKLGYELFVSDVDIASISVQSALRATLRVRNTGVAPFYYHWKVQVAVLDAGRKVAREWDTDWDLTGILPGKPDTVWKLDRPEHGWKTGRYMLLLRVVDPMPGGHTLRFANAAQDKDMPGWLSAGSFLVRPAFTRKP